MQNDMRDRLVELYKEATILYFDYLASIDEEGLTDTEGRAKFTIDHLIANGVILPPFRFGSTIWIIRSGKVCPHKITNIEINEYDMVSYGLSLRWAIRNLGKTVFPTKEQAEQKLKEMRVENG